MQFRFDKLARALAPAIAVMFAAGAAGCDGKVSFNGGEGKPLAELDLSGAPPQELVLAGPDEVRVTTGDKLAITVEGDPEARDQLRFSLKDGSLAIHRQDRPFATDRRTAIINVTMPAPREVVMAGSGRIAATTLASAAEVTVAGSGTIETSALAAETLDLTIAGSGNFRAAGTARQLDLTIAGSGSAQMDGLRVDQAKVSIAGSGNAAFTSDGTVDASIMGSGEVRVKGRARCTVSAMGSGKLVCESPVEQQGRKPKAT